MPNFAKKIINAFEEETIDFVLTNSVDYWWVILISLILLFFYFGKKVFKK